MHREPSAGAVSAKFWLRHAWPVLLLYVGVAWLFARTRLDLSIAHVVFFDDYGGGWVGAHSWLVNGLIHTGGRWAVRAVALLAILLWAFSFVVESLRDWRRPAGYFAAALVLTVATVGLLKVLTNVDCPWSLRDFGGSFPYLDLFSSRPTDLPRGRCFPAAHASSGYAFMALYFLALERSPSLARIGLNIGLLLGVMFGVAQQSRGAHFVSHDLWSAFFGWMIPLTLYAFAFGGRLYARSQRSVRHGHWAPDPSSYRCTGSKRLQPLRSPTADCPSETCSTTCVRKG